MLNALLSSLIKQTARAIPLAVAVALAGMATAQTNLVPNGSFEDTVNCNVPTQCTLLKASGWYNPNLGTTPDVWDLDLVRSCGYPMDPVNPDDIGFREAQEGMRYAGGFFWYGPGTTGNDYLMTELSEPLIAQEAYSVSLHYTLSDFALAVDHIGVWFSTDSLHANTPGRLDEVPQIKLRDPLNNYLVTDDAWVELRDTLVAAGGERWMVIGNFDPADSIEGTVAHQDLVQAAYYFLDGISLVRLDQVGVQETDPLVWWNGSGISLQHTGANTLQLTLWDMTGRLLAAAVRTYGQEMGEWRLPQLSDGVYVLQMSWAGGYKAVEIIKKEGGR